MTPEALEIRDAVLAILLPLGEGPQQIFKHVGKNRQDIEPDDQLPALIVMADRERHRPDGDAVSGEPSFTSELTITLGIKTFGDDQDEATDHVADGLEDNLQTLTQIVQRTLLTNPGFTGLVEGVTSMEEARGFPSGGETFYAWARLEIGVQYHTSFPPVILDDYRGATLKARPLGSTEATPAAGATLPQTT